MVIFCKKPGSVEAHWVTTGGRWSSTFKSWQFTHCWNFQGAKVILLWIGAPKPSFPALESICSYPVSTLRIKVFPIFQLNTSCYSCSLSYIFSDWKSSVFNYWVDVEFCQKIEVSDMITFNLFIVRSYIDCFSNVESILPSWSEFRIFLVFYHLYKRFTHSSLSFEEVSIYVCRRACTFALSCFSNVLKRRSAQRTRLRRWMMLGVVCTPEPSY